MIIELIIRELIIVSRLDLTLSILGFLTYGPMTGYDIKQRMDRSTTHFWHAKLSQIYTTLGHLQEDGYVDSSIREQEGKPDKRLYLITKEGKSAFLEWLNEPYLECSPKKETLVLKMFFSASMKKQAILAQLQIQRDLHLKQVEYYRNECLRSIQAARDEFPQLADDVVMWDATRRFGERYEDLYVQWIEEMIELVSTSAD